MPKINPVVRFDFRKELYALVEDVGGRYKEICILKTSGFLLDNPFVYKSTHCCIAVCQTNPIIAGLLLFSNNVESRNKWLNFTFLLINLPYFKT